MTDRDIMQQALEAAPLSDYSKADGDFYKWWYSHMQNDLMQPPLNGVGYRVARYIWDAALRERLTQPEQEPVQFKCTVIDDAHPNGIPLEQWAKPPQREWVDLTPKEIEACRQEGYLHSGLNAPFDFDRAAGAVLAKAKEKNT